MIRLGCILLCMTLTLKLFGQKTTGEKVNITPSKTHKELIPQEDIAYVKRLLKQESPQTTHQGIHLLQHYEKTGSPEQKAELYLLISQAFHLKGHYAEAFQYAHMAWQKAQALNQDAWQAPSLYAIAQVYLAMKNYKQALRFFKKAGVHTQGKASQVLDGKIRLGLARVYLKFGKAAEPLQYLFEALEIFREANAYPELGLCYQLITQTYLFKKDLDKAQLYWGRAWENTSQFGSPSHIAQAKLLAGQLAYQFKNYPKALHLVEESLSSALAVQARPLLFEIYTFSGDLYEALELYEKRSQVQSQILAYEDSLLGTQMDLAIKRWEEHFTLAEDQALGNQQRSSAIQAPSPHYTHPAWIVSFGAFALLFFFLFHNQQNKSKNTRVGGKRGREFRQQKEKLHAHSRQIQALNHEKNALMRSVAHDLQAPLNRVYGLVELIEMEPENLSGNQQKYLKLISQITQDSKLLIQNWLAYRSLEENNLQYRIGEMNVADLMDNIAVGHRQAAQRKQLQLLFENKIEDPIMWSDSGFISRIVDNLLSNAIKFSPVKTRIVLSLKDTPHRVYFSVRDEGVGMSKADQLNLFKKYQRLSSRPTGGESSTGLGLSIVKNLIDQLSGKISVISKPGEGSCFTVELPRNTHNRKLEIS